jgi:DNA repair protein RadA/Sms
MVRFGMKKSQYFCNKCGESASKWTGKCISCDSWGSIEEVIANSHDNQAYSKKNAVSLEKLSEVKSENTVYMKSISEFDQVCGGGLVPKSVILIGGEPGIGKSTLLLQICNEIQSDKVSIYITGEEAVEQIKLRADRLGISLSKVACASIMCVESIIATLEQYDPALVIIDSIQTLFSSSAESAPGTVTQMRACSHMLIQWAKRSNACLIIVGHVTKDGVIAGPKVVEHMVDTVLYFEGERGGQPIRLLRTIKNRFGPTDVLGVFEIAEKGLIPLKDISRAFIKQRADKIIGSAVLASIDGNRSILVEMQALISNSYMQSPRRAVVGWDMSRLHMLTAILETKCKIQLGNKDIYFNVVGGMKISEPASDLAAAMALISASSKISLGSSVVAFGELSLSGEIRGVNKMETRIAESLKLGFETICVPASCEKEGKNIVKFSKISQVADWIQKGNASQG